MHIVHVSQLVIDFHFKNMYSTNNNMKTNIYFLLMLSSLFHFIKFELFSLVIKL